MSTKDWLLALVEAALWYVFLYYFLFSVKNEVNLYQSAFALLAIAYLASISCPLVRHSGAWRRAWRKE